MNSNKLLENEGSSEVLGYVLIFGIVISAIGIVVAFGLPTLEKAKDNTDYQNNLNSIKDLRNELDKISKGPIRGSGLSFEKTLYFKRGFLEFDSNSTQVLVYQNGSLLFSEDLGSINYFFRERHIGLENNGVFMKIQGSSSSSSLVTPSFFAKKIGSDAYVRLNLVDLNGDKTGFSGIKEIYCENNNFSILTEAKTTEKPKTEDIHIELTSNFSAGWEYLFRNVLDQENINYSITRDNKNLSLNITNVEGENDIYFSLYKTEIGYEVR